MSKKQIYMVIIALIVIQVFRIIEAAGSLTVTAGKLSKMSFKNGQISWVQELNVINPTSVGVPVTAASTGILIKNERAGLAYLNGYHYARAYNSTPIEFTVRIGFAEIVAIGQDIIQQLQAGVMQFTLKGTLRSLGVNIPFTKEIGFPFTLKTT